MGRADALIGATEAQKAEGVLHLHFFIYVQMAWQMQNLQEIAQLFRQQLLRVDAVKAFNDHVRCAAYPDVDDFERRRSDIKGA